MNQTILTALLLAALVGCNSRSPSAPLEIQGFDAPTTVATGAVVTIPFAGGGTVDFYADGDGDLATIQDQVVIETGVQVGPVKWDTAGVPPGAYRIVARDSDGTVDVSDGAVTLNACRRATCAKGSERTGFATRSGGVWSTFAGPLLPLSRGTFASRPWEPKKKQKCGEFPTF